MGDWADLPADILLLVVRRILHMEDFFCFGTVCKSWQSVTLTFNKIPALPPRSPLVLFPEKVSRETRGKKGVCRFYSVSSGKTYEFEFPEATGRKCLSTFHGWLLTVDDHLNADLLHPSSRRQLALPRLFIFKDRFLYINIEFYQSNIRLAMSRNPLEEDATEDCVVLAIVRGSRILAYARLGDELWTKCKGFYYEDVVYFKGKFYTVDAFGVLYICDVSNNNAPKSITAPIPRTGVCYARYYLVESSGDLLLVSRLCPCFIPGSFYYCYSQFFVYKLEHEYAEGYPYRWKQVEYLRERALFVGGNASVSLCSSKRVKPGCIYYFSETVGAFWDTGIYNMKYKLTEFIYDPSQLCVPNPPVWYS